MPTAICPHCAPPHCSTCHRRLAPLTLFAVCRPCRVAADHAATTDAQRAERQREWERVCRSLDGKE